MSTSIEIGLTKLERVEDIAVWLDVLRAVGFAPEATTVSVSFGNLTAAIAVEDVDLSRVELDN